MTVLAINDLNVRFSTEGGNLHALRDVSFEVPERRILGIVGESGCGKSTLINAILGLLADNGRIDRGSISFEGHDLTKVDAKTMQDLRGPRISTVFQDPMGALNPVISVGQQMRNIQYRQKLSRKEKDTRSVAMLKQVRIPDAEQALDRFPHEFSGGMKQRIAIAMALMKDLQEEIGCSVLFISHHLGVIAELCDDVVVMYAGEVVERGTTRQVFNNPSHPYTARLLECDPARQTERTRLLPTIPGEIPDLRRRPPGCIFAARCTLRVPACETAPPERLVAQGHFARCIQTEGA